MNSKQRCIATICGKHRDRAPVFPLLMFFAQQRLGISYREYACNGAALAEAQLKLRDRFPIDAITSCSDAFRICADLGAEMVYPEEKPPYARTPLVRNRTELGRLVRPDPTSAKSRMGDRVEATRQMVAATGNECLVLGWVDMPYAEACSLCGVSEFMLIMLDEPALAHAILEFVTDIVIDFALAQTEAGAPMVGAGDAAASLISPDLYCNFALPYEQRVINAVHQRGGMVKLHVCGNTTKLLPHMIRSGADLFNVDHTVPLSAAMDVYGGGGHCFKGNVDPVADLLWATPEQCWQRAIECLKATAGTRYMLSAGCEIPAATSDEVFQAFCEAPQHFAA